MGLVQLKTPSRVEVDTCGAPPVGRRVDQIAYGEARGGVHLFGVNDPVCGGRELRRAWCGPAWPGDGVRAGDRAARGSRIRAFAQGMRRIGRRRGAGAARRWCDGAVTVELAQESEPAQTTMADDPYRAWLNTVAAYIITDEERRDPTTGTVPNEFKEEHVRRIALRERSVPHAGGPAGVGSTSSTGRPMRSNHTLRADLSAAGGAGRDVSMSGWVGTMWLLVRRARPG